MYCERVWNLIQACDVQSSDYKVYVSTSPSPEVENFQIKIFCPAGDRTPDLLSQRQTCYHLSPRGEIWCDSVDSSKNSLPNHVLVSYSN